MSFQVYAIKNNINDKMYVGCTTSSLKKRFDNHCHKAIAKKSDYPLHRAIRKYGRENFCIVMIEEYFCKEAMLCGEMDYIAYFQTYNTPHGYNDTMGEKVSCLAKHIPRLLK